MLRWLWQVLLDIGWYGLIAGGWLCWWRARQTVRSLERELRIMAQSWRYAARKD